MIKSMTGYSKSEAKEKGITATVEMKSLNGRFLEINCRQPRFLSHKEIEVRELVKKVLERGTVNININIEAEEIQNPFAINEQSAAKIYFRLGKLKNNLKIKENLRFEHLLMFSDHFRDTKDNENVAAYWRVTKRALRAAINNVEAMRKREGTQLAKDIKSRLSGIKKNVDKIESLSTARVPEEREKLRMRVAQLFESDEIDEQRLQMEMVLLADKLDISEECVRLHSHLTYFNNIMRAKGSSGKKMNFLVQEIYREINTIGSKANDANISQIVVNVKEELERIREQVQNIE